ncbi:hypothetical protein QBC42DRAFT_201724 [Cladorrhinum samala]|uniref:HTH APSES-type domain-containing protein n=1 Tax=Cladorrhinum samala TaxID=585594 RepID=A0AAV9HNA9_9PEZI|nr:hypothetical protein QBC42DRAFT_201724 [Cladorrhinum samala]
MVSVASLLNPEEPLWAPTPSSRSSSHSHSSSRQLVAPSVPVSSAERPPSSIIDPINMTENTSRGLLKSKAKGNIVYEPFENLDAESLREVRRFRVCPFGRIMETFRRIPYNSSKKDFYQKTGRESFDVFQYDFKLPNSTDDTVYTVMWDYGVGLVRMTPFFKCLEYSKTTPAKMLGQNPGLKDITYSITGGSIKAQGYWMPYDCAKAVCATFCYQIAGALIPLFGPDFPSKCVPEGAPGFRRMVIDPAVVAQAKREAAQLCQFPRSSSGPLPSPTPSRHISPRPPQRSMRSNDSYNHRRAEYERQMLLSPYGPDSDLDYRAAPGREPYARNIYGGVPPLRTFPGGGGGSRGPPSTAVRASLQSPRGWKTVNHHTYAPAHYANRSVPFPDDNPHQMLENVSSRWLTAVPRSPSPFGQGRRPLPGQYRTTLHPEPRTAVGTLPRPGSIMEHESKNNRPKDNTDDTDDNHDNGRRSQTNPAPSPSHTSESSSPSLSSPSPSSPVSATTKRPAVEEDAAMMLMQLKEGPDQQKDGEDEKKEMMEQDKKALALAAPASQKLRTPLPGSKRHRDVKGELAMSIVGLCGKRGTRDRETENRVKRLRRNLV